MAEGDLIHRLARRLTVAIGGEPVLQALAPSPESPLRRQPERLGSLRGRECAGADARGKHLFVRFEGELVLHSHLGMRGSWQVHEHGAPWRRPIRSAWVVLEARTGDAGQFGGSRLALRTENELRADPRLRSLGPDVLEAGFEPGAGLAALRGADQERPLGDVLLDQRVLAGIGNVYKSEGCFAARVDPWRPLAGLSDEELVRVVVETASLMRAGLETGERPRDVYRRASMPCLRCGERVRSRGQGDANRTTYWCPACQP